MSVNGKASGPITPEDVFNKLTDRFKCALCGKTSRPKQLNCGSRGFPLCNSCGARPRVASTAQYTFAGKDAYGRITWNYIKKIKTDRRPFTIQEMEKIFEYLLAKAKAGQTVTQFSFRGWNRLRGDRDHHLKLVVDIEGPEV